MLLTVDSSSVTAAAALCDDAGNVIKSEFRNSGLTHSETLLPMIKQVMGDVRFSDLNAIAVTAGPGSFTGVRIGVATVKGLAFAAALPCIPVSALEAVAWNFSAEGAVICAVMDARRMQFYNALFQVQNGKIRRLCPDRAVALEQLADEIRQYDTVIAAGDGAELFCSHCGHAVLCDQKDRYVTGRGVALAAQNKEKINSDSLMPVYLRLSQAERELKLKKER